MGAGSSAAKYKGVEPSESNVVTVKPRSVDKSPANSDGAGSPASSPPFEEPKSTSEASKRFIREVPKIDTNLTEETKLGTGQ
ncbi:unnamed protein product [Cladocopium goreaui]|uniref:Uncharacterized protein n=1 Tax=Cladocopium goreaui TaxID=2562237 RepID=A0A9P1DTX9_9DINO|nr:unnamed protein product [Cladocopium goreaui]